MGLVTGWEVPAPPNGAAGFPMAFPLPEELATNWDWAAVSAQQGNTWSESMNVNVPVEAHHTLQQAASQMTPYSIYSALLLTGPWAKVVDNKGNRVTNKTHILMSIKRINIGEVQS